MLGNLWTVGKKKRGGWEGRAQPCNFSSEFCKGKGLESRRENKEAVKVEWGREISVKLKSSIGALRIPDPVLEEHPRTLLLLGWLRAMQDS